VFIPFDVNTVQNEVWTPRVVCTMTVCVWFSSMLIVRLVFWPENCPRNLTSVTRGSELKSSIKWFDYQVIWHYHLIISDSAMWKRLQNVYSQTRLKPLSQPKWQQPLLHGFSTVTDHSSNWFRRKFCVPLPVNVQHYRVTEDARGGDRGL
jgi:hypothetical protein